MRTCWAFHASSFVMVGELLYASDVIMSVFNMIFSGADGDLPIFCVLYVLWAIPWYMEDCTDQPCNSYWLVICKNLLNRCHNTHIFSRKHLFWLLFWYMCNVKHWPLIDLGDNAAFLTYYIIYFFVTQSGSWNINISSSAILICSKFARSLWVDVNISASFVFKLNKKMITNIKK